MTYYTPDQEPSTDRLLLLSLPAEDGGGSYRHLTARVIRVAAQMFEVRGESKSRYGDSDSVGFRHAKWAKSTKTGLYVEDMVLRGQMTVRELDGSAGAREVYGTGLEFQPYKVDLQMSVRMAKTLTTLDKAFNTLDTEAGSIPDSDFAGIASRLMIALGIKRCAMFREPGFSCLGKPENLVLGDISRITMFTEQLLDRVYGKRV